MLVKTKPQSGVPLYTCDPEDPGTIYVRGLTQPMDRVELRGPTGYVQVSRCDIPWLIGVLVKEFGKSYETLPIEQQ